MKITQKDLDDCCEAIEQFGEDELEVYASMSNCMIYRSGSIFVDAEKFDPVREVWVECCRDQADSFWVYRWVRKDVEVLGMFLDAAEAIRYAQLVEKGWAKSQGINKRNLKEKRLEK